jgi:hypothetical protein
MMQTLQNGLDEISGRRMSSVEFVHDYIQFRFDGPCLTTFTLPSIKKGNQLIGATDEGYKDGLCSQIGVQVERVIVGSEELIVEFANLVAFAVSLRNKDYNGPEAIEYSGDNGRVWVA